MKILFLGNFTGRGWDGSITDENHIAEALEELGHEVVRAQRERALDFASPTSDIDFTLVAQWNGYEQNTLIRLPKPLVFWAYDFQEWGQQWCEDLIAVSDLYLSKRVADSKYPNWQYLSQDFAPKFLDKKKLPVEKDIDVLFTGSYLPWATERNETLKSVDEKFNLVIHSVNQWPDDFKDVRGPVMDEGLPELYARAKVVLSIDHTLEAGYHSDRNAQILCCGARPLFRYIPMSENTFHDHVDYFYSIEDCLEKVEQRLRLTPPSTQLHEDYVFAQNNLKVKNRVQDLLTIVGSVL